MNFFTIILFSLITATIIIQSILVKRHIKYITNHREQVPPDFVEKISIKSHQKAADYTIAKTKLYIIEMILGSIFLLLWTIAGGLQLLDVFWNSFSLSELLTGTLVILSVFLIMGVLDLPITIYRNFKLEQSFGFNKMTAKIFISDLIKQTILSLVIGIPIIISVLWIMKSAGHYWWAYAWAVWLGFNLFIMWLYPAFVAPLFNKFRDLEDKTLKNRIEKLLTKNGFKSQGISVIDGSTRSTHGNAYFAGLGSNKRIVFFDTLINELNHDEIEAVLAHELGHFKCNHIKKRITVLGIFLFIGFALLAWLINENWFYSGLGVKQASEYMALILFVMVMPVFTFLIKPAFSFISRKHEFEADNFATKHTKTEHLITALVKLYRENANTLTPHPWYSAFHDSHPPASTRISNLKRRV